MKRRMVLMAALLCAACALAQHGGPQETVTMKDGSVLRGWTSEGEPGKTLVLTTKSGQEKVLDLNSVMKVEGYSTELDYHQRPGLDYEAQGGYMEFTDDQGGGAAVGELTIGKRFSKHFFVGVGGGIIKPDGKPLFPIAATGKVIFPLNAYRLEPFVSVRAGYVINTTEDTEYLDYSNYYTFHIMPGIQIPINRRLDFTLQAGYTHLVPTKEQPFQKNVGMLTVTAGIVFHHK